MNKQGFTYLLSGVNIKEGIPLYHRNLDPTTRRCDAFRRIPGLEDALPLACQLRLVVPGHVEGLLPPGDRGEVRLLRLPVLGWFKVEPKEHLSFVGLV